MLAHLLRGTSMEFCGANKAALALMVVQESRILELSIFKTLEDNLRKVDFSKVLLDVRTIADEADSQLKQQILGYMSSKPAKSAAG